MDIIEQDREKSNIYKALKIVKPEEINKKASDIKSVSNKLYKEVNEKGIEMIKSLFSNGRTLSERLKYDISVEYVKKMILSQLDIGKMLLTHRFYDAGFDTIPEFRKVSDNLRAKLNNEDILQFDDEIIEDLFGNTLDISSNEDYEEWKNFICDGRHQSFKLDDIFLEEEFKYNYEKEKNTIKKFIKSFKYKKMQKGNILEDPYIKKTRKIMREKIIANPDDTIVALGDCNRTIEKGVVEYESLKEIEDISRMVLTSLIGNQGDIINIEEECKRFREEMKSSIGMTSIGKEYRQKQVTLGSESGIKKGPVIQTIHFAEIPNAIKKLQEEYEKEYNTEQSKEDYIKHISRICANFIYIQPYEDGNKRTGICLFNEMLLSKGIIPPPISLINDEQMAIAFNKVHDDSDYSMLENITVEKYRKMMSSFENNSGHKNERLKELECENIEQQKEK